MIGTDIISIKRMKRLINNEGFLNKVFTEDEQKYCKGDVFHFATTFAAKEAFFKAIGTGITDMKHVQVVRMENGKPIINSNLTDKKIFVSMSYEEEYAVAFVMLK